LATDDGVGNMGCVKHVARAAAEEVRKRPRLYSVARSVKRFRRRVFELFGSDRYSHPAYADLDRKLEPYVSMDGGVFVEAGAYDGYWGSNTYWFERFRGWSGVLVEPVPELAARARKERPRSRVFQCALVPPELGGTSVSLLSQGVMSVLAGPRDEAQSEHALRGDRSSAVEIVVPGRCLSDVLDEAGVGEIDLMTLDVEGLESAVLRGLDLRKHAPRFLLVEILQGSQARTEVERLLGTIYRHEAKLSSRDHLYRRVDNAQRGS
jgi:FkbM family methyltransferase